MTKDNIKHIIIDLSYFMVQRGHIFKDLTFNGKHTGIYYGILKLVKSLVKQYSKAKIFICRDGLPVVKKELYPAYKANRDEVDYKPSKDFSLIKNLQKMLATYPNVYFAYNSYHEADDLIASLALEYPEESVILSGDNDFLQLICKGIRISKSIKDGKLELRTSEYIKEKYKVEPENLLLFRALQGDKSDNITGVCDTRRIRKILEKGTKIKDIKENLTKEEFAKFVLNLKLMSLIQFRKNPIHKYSILNVTPDETLFETFGLEKLRYVKDN